jgi:hypothetical protein
MRLLGLRVRFFGFVPAVGLGLAFAGACGGSVGGDLSPGGDANVGGSGGFGAGGTGSLGGFFGGGTGGKDAGKDAKQDSTAGFGGTGGFIDEGCPDAEPPPPQKECDPFEKPSTTCGFGTACYPYVIYPQHKCEFEIYGTLCAPVGTGKQGDPCLSENCDEGFVCVLTGQGTECVQLCQLTGEDLCPNGLFCLPIDVEGFGGCY